RRREPPRWRHVDAVDLARRRAGGGKRTDPGSGDGVMEESMRERSKAAAVTDVLAADFAPTRSPLARARHAPPGIYSDPEIFALEKERIFMREWLFVARVEEVENPGDYLALRVLGEPVVLAR